MGKYLVPIDISGVSDQEGFFQKMKNTHSDGMVHLLLEGAKMLVGFHSDLTLFGRLQVLKFITGFQGVKLVS